VTRTREARTEGSARAPGEATFTVPRPLRCGWHLLTSLDPIRSPPLRLTGPKAMRILGMRLQILRESLPPASRSCDANHKDTDMFQAGHLRPYSWMSSVRNSTHVIVEFTVTATHMTLMNISSCLYGGPSGALTTAEVSNNIA